MMEVEAVCLNDASIDKKYYFVWLNTDLRKCFTFDVNFSTDLSIHPGVANGWGYSDHWAAERETSWQSTGGGGGGGGGDKVNTDFIPNMTSASEDYFLIVTHMSSVREIPFEVQLTR